MSIFIRSVKSLQLGIYLVDKIIYGIVDGISYGIPVIAVKRLIYAVADKRRSIIGKSAVDILYGVFDSKSVNFLLHLKHLIAPAVVIFMLFIADSKRIFIIIGSNDALHKSCNALGILCALAEIVAVDLGIVIVFIGIFVTGNGNEEYVLLIAEGLCPKLGSGFDLIQSAYVENIALF